MLCQAVVTKELIKKALAAINKVISDIIITTWSKVRNLLIATTTTEPKASLADNAVVNSVTDHNPC